jgi:acid phosphatase type 7
MTQSVKELASRTSKRSEKAAMSWMLTTAMLISLAGLASADEVFVGAGDIASCSSSNDEKTALLLDGVAGTVFTLGDNAYPKGTPEQFTNCYGPGWGRHKARTRPAIGNHEYMTPGAQPYLDYFGVSKSYSYNLGDWHIVSLDSMCQLAENGGSCSAISPTVTWLKSDLAANPTKCTLVYFHHPRWSSGKEHGNTTRMSAAWKIMYAAGVDIVLSGHNHSYERFAPLNPNGVIDAVKGIRSFVVGTGGASLGRFGTIKSGSEVRNSTTFGVLKLTLRTSDYLWTFVPVAGQTFTDAGSGVCH